ncbi:hypothetical protein ES332_D08G013500v1 [Gossypium tomentosum]|uniref:Uncharacterized protein n=1 Tax=Gossypium tomentosum TaxID=34277 RepID=A0A5D2JPG0_GOSTO|nr:hypothetical protein ES332_D08G013500v1 [Gossypium tomentosum]
MAPMARKDAEGTEAHVRGTTRRCGSCEGRACSAGGTCVGKRRWELLGFSASDFCFGLYGDLG